MATYKHDNLTSVEMAKMELEEYARIHRQVVRAEIEISRIRDNLTSSPGISYDKIKVQVSGVQDKVGDGVNRILEKEAERTIAYMNAQNKKDEILRYIDDLPFPYDLILEVRYTKGHRTLKECVEEIGYEYKYLCGLHGKALEAYAQLRGFSKEHDKKY